MTKLTAQDLYDLRAATGFISGADLHSAFDELVGEMSPPGKVAVEVPDDHWLAQAAKFGSAAEFNSAMQRHEPEFDASLLSPRVINWSVK